MPPGVCTPVWLFFNKIKHYRPIATRYNKLARNVLAAVQLVAAIILLN